MSLGINYDSEATYSSSCLLGVASLFASDSNIVQLFDRNGTFETLKRDKSPHAPVCADVFERLLKLRFFLFLQNCFRFIRRFFFLSNRDEDMSGKRWADDTSVAWSLIAANVKGMKVEETFDECLSKVNKLLNAPPKTVQSRETQVFHNALQSASSAIATHLSKDAEFHQNNLKQLVEHLRQLLHLKEEIHVLYTVNNFRARRAFVDAAFSAKIASKSSEHFDGSTLLSTHPIFSLDFLTIRDVFWKADADKRQRMLDNADLMRKMFSGLQGMLRKMVKDVSERVVSATKDRTRASA